MHTLKSEKLSPMTTTIVTAPAEPNYRTFIPRSNHSFNWYIRQLNQAGAFQDVQAFLSFVVAVKQLYCIRVLCFIWHMLTNELVSMLLFGCDFS